MMTIAIILNGMTSSAEPQSLVEREQFVATSSGLAKLEWTSELSTLNIQSISVVSTQGVLELSSSLSSKIGVWEQEVLRAGNIRLIKSQNNGDGFQRLVISQFSAGFENRIDYTWSSTRRAFEVVQLSRLHTKIFFDESHASTERSCGETSVSGDVSSLFDFSDELQKKAKSDHVDERAIDTSCSAVATKLKSALASMLVRYPNNGKRFNACYQDLLDGRGDGGRLNTFVSGFIDALANGAKISCSAENVKGLPASYEAGSQEIKISKSWVEKQPSQSAVTSVVFHEAMHASGLKNEDAVKDVVACCTSNLDQYNTACKSARKRLAGNDIDKKEGLQSKVASNEGSIEGRSVGLLPVVPVSQGEIGAQVNGKDENLSGSLSKPVRDVNQNSKPTSALSKSKRTDAEKPANNSPPPAIKATEMNKPSAPEAVAERSHTVIRTGIAAAKDALAKVDFDKIAASTVGVETAQAKEPATSGPRHTNSIRQASAPSVDADGNQIVFQTKVVGQNRDGTPKIQLPDGTQLPSFKAFGNVEPVRPAPQAAALASAPAARQAPQASTYRPSLGSPSSSSGGSGSSYRPSASTTTGDTVTQHTAPDARSFAAASGSKAEARASGGGGGDSGSSGGSFDGSSGGGGGGARTPSSAQHGSGSSNQKTLSISQLKPRSQSVSDLQNVQVSSWSDVKVLIRSASNPQQLIKQQWFIDHLERQDIRAQVIDHGVGYGSSDPLVRYDLKFLSTP